LIHEESDIIKRTIRDIYDDDTKNIIIEGNDAYKKAKSFMKLIMPKNVKYIKKYIGKIPLFYKENIESKLNQIYDSSIKLQSGGYLVINPTEALVSIDINSGSATTETDVERTALATNLEAAEEISRQIKIRDLSGLIIIDFIDMINFNNRRKVERCLKEKLNHFVSKDAFNIDGLGKKVIQNFWDLNMIKYPADIFNLDFKKISSFEGWGDLSASNLEKAIKKSQKISLDKLIFAIGIRHIGQENAKTLAKYFVNIKKFEELFDREKRKKILNYLLELDGIGETQVNSLEIFFSNSNNSNTVSNLVKELNVTDFKTSKSGIFYGKTIMFTGGLSKMSRAEAKALVEKEGGKIIGTASKKLDYLVVGDSKPTPKKIEKAKQLNIKILDENGWYSLLNR